MNEWWITGWMDVAKGWVENECSMYAWMCVFAPPTYLPTTHIIGEWSMKWVSNWLSSVCVNMWVYGCLSIVCGLIVIVIDCVAEVDWLIVGLFSIQKLRAIISDNEFVEFGMCVYSLTSMSTTARVARILEQKAFFIIIGMELPIGRSSVSFTL